MAGSSLDLCFLIGNTSLCIDLKRNLEVVYALIVRVMTNEFSACSLDLSLVKR